MSKQWYCDQNFRGATLSLIDTMNEIIEEYVEQGFRLTVRQLYYQMVARGHIENTQQSYGRICSVVNDAKMAGLMDWDAIEDRTREFIRRTRWQSGKEIVQAAASGFHMDMWANQEHRVFVIVEKEALAGVLEVVCNEFDIPLLAARGYPSGTVLREFALRDLLPAMGYNRNGERLEGVKDGEMKQRFIILHLGDHDPSGIDMSRDLSERLYTFVAGVYKPHSRLASTLFTRIALNMDQIEEQSPPENPAKVTDSRFKGYEERFGDKSWELDALRPEYLANLIRRHTRRYIDAGLWEKRQKEVAIIKKRLLKVAEDFS